MTFLIIYKLQQGESNFPLELLKVVLNLELSVSLFANVMKKATNIVYIMLYVMYKC